MANAVLWDLLTAVQDAIHGLELVGISPANVRILKVLSLTEAAGWPSERFPCVAIAPDRETIDANAGTTNTDDIVYPITIAIVASEKNEAAQAGDKQSQRFGLYLKWRQQIRRLFHNVRITNSSIDHNCTVQPLAIVDPTAWERGLFASGLRIMARAREGRSTA